MNNYTTSFCAYGHDQRSSCSLPVVTLTSHGTDTTLKSHFEFIKKEVYKKALDLYNKNVPTSTTFTISTTKFNGITHEVSFFRFERSLLHVIQNYKPEDKDSNHVK